LRPDRGSAAQRPKAIALLSGGLDSTLAVKLILDQGIEVEALNFVTPFCNCNRKGRGCEARRIADEFGIPCRTIAITDEFLQVVKRPRYGYGSGMNPCLDCRILMFSRARQRMEETDAAFVFTGEVLGQRPMSQIEVKNCGSPITLLRGEAGEQEIGLAAAITARYSDAQSSEAEVHYGAVGAALSGMILSVPLGEDELAELRV